MNESFGAPGRQVIAAPEDRERQEVLLHFSVPERDLDHAQRVLVRAVAIYRSNGMEGDGGNVAALAAKPTLALQEARQGVALEMIALAA